MNKNLNLATVVMYGSEVYSKHEWEWDKKGSFPFLTGTIERKIQRGCRKIHGSTHEKSSQFMISGNLLDLDSMARINPNVTIKLCPTKDWLGLCQSWLHHCVVASSISAATYQIQV